MNYITHLLNRKITFLHSSNKKNELEPHYQAKFEFYLLLTLGYIWNKNIEKIIYIVVKTTTDMAQRGKFLLFCLHKCKKIPFFFVISSNYSNFATTNLK